MAVQNSLIKINRSLRIADSGTALIRFDDGRESWLWVQPESILFVQSADHYIKTLIQQENQKLWTIRHSSLRELLPLLNNKYFVRLNKFYIVNRSFFSHVDHERKTLFFKDGFSICLRHSISPFVLDLMLL